MSVARTAKKKTSARTANKKTTGKGRQSPCHPAIDDDMLAWLRRVCADEKPPRSVVAYNIGILETEQGYAAYLSGAASYDPDDDDWACDETFTPTERYLALRLRPVDASWEVALELVAATVRGYLASPAGSGSFLAKARAVTVGFDGGDLLRIR